MPKIFVSTVPFGEIDPKPLELLKETGWDFLVNPLNRKLTPEEVGEFAKDCDGLIAGTEDIHIVLERAKSLKMVSRVGIGLDSVPLQACKENGITVSFTPDAVTKAVAEMTIGAMISLTRFIPNADRNARNLNWQRLAGRRIGESTIGLIGFGRISSEIINMLMGFKPQKILVNDIKNKDNEILELVKKTNLNIEHVSKDEIYRCSDIISLHVPLSKHTKGMIDKNVLKKMKKSAFIINYARGGIINESDLYNAIKQEEISGAAIDVYETEPYKGKLIELDNILFTQHMGSCSLDCRALMEIEATEEIIRYFKNQPLSNEVPIEEYEYQK